MRLIYKFLLTLAVMTTVAAVMAPAVSAQSVGIGLSPARVNFGTVGKGGQYTQTVRIYDTSNATAIAYTATPQGFNGTVTANPSSGNLAAKSNATVTLTLNVPSNATAKTYNGTLLFNSSTRSGADNSSSSVLPALAARVNYTVGNYQAPAAASSSGGLSWQVALILVVLVVLVGAVSLYFVLREQRGNVVSKGRRR